MDSIVAGAFSALPYGYSVLEAVWEKGEDGRIRLAKIEEKPLEWFKPQRDGTLRYFAPDGSTPADGEVVDTRLKFFLTRHRPSYRQPYGEALLSRLYWPWFFRYNGWRFWMQFLERFGMPILLGKVNKPSDFVKALTELGIDSVIAVGKEEEITAAMPSGGDQQFERLENALCKRVQKAILGQTLTSDVGSSGSYAAAKVHDYVREDKRNADIRMISPTVQAIVDAHLALNFGASESLDFVMEDGTGLELERAKRDAELVKAGVVKLTEDYLLRVYDFEEGDIEIPETPDPSADPAAPQGQRGADDPEDGGESEKAGDKGKSGRFAGSSRPSRRRSFTAAQEEVERIGDAALAAVQAPISQEELRGVILQARDPEDLAERLALVMREADTAEFRRTLEQALFAADVVGYVHAEERR
ncbi:MAG: DUF935 domain-containing protein [Burkholderiales bacterium]|nr:DUF935 domain-containing protein [Burkholderiales bacterium]